MNPTHSFELLPVDAESFTGTAHSGLVAESQGEAPVRIYWVRFEPAARTHWHRHEGTQILLVREGRCLVQREDGPIEVHPEGSVIRFPPGERHWHGAPPEAPMVHVAINLESTGTRWEEPVHGGPYGTEAGPTRGARDETPPGSGMEPDEGFQV